MREEAELGLRRLLLTVSTFVFLASLLAIYGLRFLPEVSVHLQTSFTVYLFFFSAVSVAGFVAAIKRNSSLITVFAIHLLIDSVLLFIPRILLIRFSFSLPSLICTNSKYEDVTLEDIQHAANSMQGVTSKLESKLVQLSSPAWSESSCMLWMWGLEVIFVGLILLHIGSQAVLAARLFGYASWLSRKRRLEQVQMQHV